MTIQKGIWLCILVWIFVPFQMLYAGQCDDVYAKAKGIHESADEAVNQKDYTQAAELYREAAKYYEQATNMRDCSCPKIPGASRSNADSCRNMAVKCREYATEVRLFEEYNRAKDIFNEGNTSAQSENGKIASEAAKQARNAAELAREYQKRQ
jgi:hypothetical protein